MPPKPVTPPRGSRSSVHSNSDDATPRANRLAGSHQEGDLESSPTRHILGSSYPVYHGVDDHDDSDDEDIEDIEPPAPKRKPPPFAPFDAATSTTLFDLINMQLLRPPIFVSLPTETRASSSSSTKNLSKTELALEGHQVMKKIVYARGMLRRLMKRARNLLAELPIEWKGDGVDLTVGVSLSFTSLGLPPLAFMEKDYERWFITVVLEPALFAVMALRHKAIPKLPRGVEQLAGEPDSSVFEQESDVIWPYIGSSKSQKVIPDCIVVDADQLVKATVEVKTPKVMGNTAQGGEFLFETLMHVHEISGVSRPGCAVRFNWPESKSGGDTQTRVLAQIWTQLWDNSVDLGMLTSYVLSMFCYRDELEQTLYISESFEYTDNIFLATVAWMAMAMGIPGFTQDLLVLPQAQVDHWALFRGVMDDETVGVVPSSTATYIKDRQAEEIERAEAGLRTRS